MGNQVYAVVRDPLRLGDLASCPDVISSVGAIKTCFWYLEHQVWLKNILTGAYQAYNESVCVNG